MIARCKPSLYRLTQMLRALESNPGDYRLLLTLQRALVGRIRRTDRRIAVLKKLKDVLSRKRKTGRLSKAESRSLKRKIASVADAISGVQHVQFTWRCFGDGIAFIYLDKYALKHMLYNTHDYNVRQPPGALSDKQGFKLEWLFMRAVVRKQVPAMLCDITNILRHGDVCVLVGPDPIPIELKLSSNRNARVERQTASLQALGRFFKQDKAVGFRGFPKIKRLEAPLVKTNYAAAMNECIARSRIGGFAATSPESGLVYMCVRSVEAATQVQEHIGRQCLAVVLNEATMKNSWMPYYPFTLSIRDPKALYEFVGGDITLIVVVDAQVVMRAYEVRGLRAEFIEHPDLILMASRLGSKQCEDPFSFVSKHFFLRLFYEFATIGLLADLDLFNIQKMEAMIRDGLLPESVEASVDERPVFKPMRWTA